MTHEVSTTVVDSPESGRSMIEVASSRQAQEVQAMILLAKKFPRDEDAAIARITTACKRKKLAEASMYQYARGGSDITGPSIRLAECLAQCWGNIEHGIKELSQANGESVVEAYCWDMETNYRSSKVFTVKHVRSTKSGTYALTDPRDVYEMVANQGARRVRSCILAVIPRDIQDLAVEQCTKTLLEGHTEPLVDRVRKMFAKYAEFGVTKEQIEARCQRKSEAFTEQNLLDLRKIYMSLKDGMSKPDEWFDMTLVAPQETAPAEAGTSKTQQTAERMKKRRGKDTPETAPDAPPADPAPSEAAAGLPFFAGYTDALQLCKTEAEVRQVCNAMILPQKEQLAPDVYAEFLRMRDAAIARINAHA